MTQIDKKSLAIVFISSFLLGIWLTVNTIALRNVLLILGTSIATLYWAQWAKLHQYRAKEFLGTGFFNRAPLLLIGLMFIWVVFHYLFLSQFQDRQWNELTSTWLRALLATILGSATGIVLQRYSQLAWLIWLGLWISFLVLICQYVPKALASQNMLATDFFGDYIFWGKFNGVLAGIILIAGVLGLFIDEIRNTNGRINLEIKLSQFRFQKLYFITFVVIGIIVPVYSFVFIFDAKNGIGVTAILFTVWFVIALINIITFSIKRCRKARLPMKWSRWLVLPVIISVISVILVTQHLKINPGWGSLIEDISLSMDVDANQHWQNPDKYPAPKRSNGEPVAGNVYERVSFAVLGLRLIRQNIYGIGYFRGFTDQLSQRKIEFTRGAVYTHSAWIDLGLAFGLPGLILMPVCLILILINSLFTREIYYRASIISISLCILILYLVGEYGFQHGIEFLFFMVAFLSTLSWKRV